MQEQILILLNHSQNSPSIPINCLAFIYKKNESLHSVLQVIGSHQLDNEISSAMPVYNLVTCVFLISLILAAWLSFSQVKVLVLKELSLQHQSKYPRMQFPNPASMPDLAANDYTGKITTNSGGRRWNSAELQHHNSARVIWDFLFFPQLECLHRVYSGKRLSHSWLHWTCCIHS